MKSLSTSLPELLDHQKELVYKEACFTALLHEIRRELQGLMTDGEIFPLSLALFTLFFFAFYMHGPFKGHKSKYEEMFLTFQPSEKSHNSVLHGFQAFFMTTLLRNIKI